ncbi:MAG TPA: VCBS repeat-containing protein [Planctomycetota bacterium]|nr:VCBS repeat-containing protein [Planctomycetota bacterium]
MLRRVRRSFPGVSPVLAAAVALAATSAASRAQMVFEPPRVSDGGSVCSDLVVGDFDGDGVPDAIVSHTFPSLQPKPSFQPGLGDGSFGPPVTIPFVSAARVQATGDFDEDGHLDVAMIDWTPSVSVALGDGSGGFGAPLPLSAVPFSAPESIDVADFDVDGHLDLVIQYTHLQIQFGGLVVAFGHGDGHFDVVIVFHFPLGPFVEGFHSARVGDTNGDGLADIVVTSQPQPPAFLSNGDGTFTNVPCSGCYGFAEAFDLADLNGDGREDAVTTSSVLIAQPSGGFGPPQPLAPAFVPNRVALGDLDGDGAIDAVLTRNYVQEEGAGTLETGGDVLVLRGLGNGTFQMPGVVVSHVPQPRGLALADADLDGRLDIVVAEEQGAGNTLRVLLNHTYAPGSPYLDLGGVLGGTNGYPIQLASGTLVPGQPFAFQLFNGPPSGFAYHVVGLAALAAPFKGGTLIPFPHLLNGPLPLNAQGAITLAANWPAGGSGLTLWIQFWMPNGGGPAGFVASSGVRAQIP